MRSLGRENGFRMEFRKNNETEKKPIQTAQELLDTFLKDSSEFDDELDDLRDELKKQGQTSEEIEKDISTKEADFVSTYIDQLIETRNPSTQVFKTDRGSIYFHFEDGTTIRFKQPRIEQEGKALNIQYPSYLLTFVTTQEAERLKKLKGHLTGVTIETTEMKTGAHPLEIGLLEQDDRYPVIQETEDGLVIQGTKNLRENDKANADDSPPYHIGSAINEILS